MLTLRCQHKSCGMKNKFLYLSIAALIALLFFACRKKDKYPAEPHIEYVSFDRFGEDSAMLHINFTDGDGDFGLDPSDTDPKYSGEFYNNAYVYYYYRNPAGNFVLYDMLDTITGNFFSYHYRLPVITPEGKNKSLSGEMIFKLDYPYHVHDTVLYEVYIYDRALHKSNVVRTETIIF